MEIVLIRHGQPNWVTGVNAYTAHPKLTDLGRLHSEKSSTVFDKSSVDELWVSHLTRAQETHLPFKNKSISKKIHVFKWLKEMEDEEEKELFGKSQEEVMDFFEKRNTQSFEEWIVGNHGQYMEKFRDNIILNLESELEKGSINPSDNKYDRLFDLNNSEIQKIIYPFEENLKINFHSLQVWKYAKVTKVSSGPQIDPKFPIAIAGDFMEGPNVESAFISGEKAADLIFKRLQ